MGPGGQQAEGRPLGALCRSSTRSQFSSHGRRRPGLLAAALAVVTFLATFASQGALPWATGAPRSNAAGQQQQQQHAEPLERSSAAALLLATNAAAPAVGHPQTRGRKPPPSRRPRRRRPWKTRSSKASPTVCATRTSASPTPTACSTTRASRRPPASRCASTSTGCAPQGRRRAHHTAQAPYGDRRGAACRPPSSARVPSRRASPPSPSPGAAGEARVHVQVPGGWVNTPCYQQLVQKVHKVYIGVGAWRAFWGGTADARRAPLPSCCAALAFSTGAGRGVAIGQRQAGRELLG